MSEEKMYAVKNGEGKYWEFGCKRNAFLDLSDVDLPVTIDKDLASEVARNSGGHVVTFVEEPKKVVLSEEQAKIVKEANDYPYPEIYIFDHVDHDDHSSYIEEYLLMNAYVNGYTVKKDKKYNVKVPYAEGWHFKKYSSASKLGARNNWRPFPAKDIDSNMSKELFQFTEAEIEQYGLQDCEKEEVTDNEQ